MPAKVSKVKGGYKVSTPSGTKAKKTTKKKAEAQKRLLNAVDHGFKPTGQSEELKERAKRGNRTKLY